MAESGIFPYTFICFTVQSLQSPLPVLTFLCFNVFCFSLGTFHDHIRLQHLVHFVALFLSPISTHPGQNSISNISSFVISTSCMDDFAFVLEEDGHSILKMILPKKLTFRKEFHQGLYNNLQQMTTVETQCSNQSQTTTLTINVKDYNKNFQYRKAFKYIIY